MKLLLTSNGLSNDSIANALEELVGKPRQQTKIAFIPTAAFPEEDLEDRSKSWLVDDLYRIKEFAGFVDIVSLADLSSEAVIERLTYVDVIFVGGGNTFYLSYWMEKSGLFTALPQLLNSRVYAGISAGSMVATQSLRAVPRTINNVPTLYDEEYEELGPVGQSADITAKLVDFVVRPHYNSSEFSRIRDNYLEPIAQTVKLPLYAIDDQSAVKVDGDKVEVVSEGAWKLYNSR